MVGVVSIVGDDDGDDDDGDADDEGEDEGYGDEVDGYVGWSRGGGGECCCGW